MLKLTIYLTFILWILAVEGKRSKNQTSNLINNMQSTVQNEVSAQLERLHELRSKYKIMFGIDGPTVATYKPNNKTLIIQNGHLYECSSKISHINGDCFGGLNPFKFEKKEDFCYSTTVSSINDWLCLSDSGSSAIIVFNNEKPSCSGRDNGQTLLIEKDDFNKMCTPLAKTVTYKHFSHNRLTTVGKDVQCSNSEPQVCALNVEKF